MTHIEQLIRDETVLGRQYEYEDSTTYAFDLGAGASAAVDVIGETIVLVVDGDQQEFDLPVDETDPQAFIHNGVLTIEVETDR